MRIISLTWILFIVISISFSCKKESVYQNSQTTSHDVWLVNIDDVLNLGGEKDRIQSIDSPAFVPIHDVNLHEDEIVFAVHYKGVTKVYPSSVMGAHEIVNDQINDYYYAVTFCPLTESGIAWNRTIAGEVTEFGVSGMLYKDNLIPYDRNTLSNWSQMGAICINGPTIGYELETMLLVELPFHMIQNSYPDALVLDYEACGEGICRHLKSGNDFGDPDDGDKPELPPANRYYGVLNKQSPMLFETGLFSDSIHLVQTTFGKLDLLVIGYKEQKLFLAFQKDQKLSDYIFYPVQNSLPIIMGDDNGNMYDIFGKVISGPDKGFLLSSPTAYRAHTFAWQSLFNNISVYN